MKSITESDIKKLSIKLKKIIIIIGIIFINLYVHIFYNNYFLNEVFAENKSEDVSAYLSYKDDPSADDIALLSQYLYEQSLGVMPKGANGKKVAYLTFDDGPSETVTSLILDILKRENVRATFFILGKSIEKSDENKKIIKRMALEGHSIGNHTYSHDYNYLYPNKTVNVDNFMLEIEKTNSILREILGNNFSTRVIRCPGGHMSWGNMKYLDDILKSSNYYQVDWNTLSKDAEGKHKDADELLKEVIRTLGNKEKAVILMHDTYGKEETAKVLPVVIKYLRDQGYEFKTIK